jgi:hypothetical protein
MQRESPARRAGKCVLIGNPIPRFRISCPMCFHHQLKNFMHLEKESSQLNLKKGGNLMQQCKLLPTFLLVLALSRWFLMRVLSHWILV